MKETVTAIDAQIVNGQVYLSAADLAAKFTEVAVTLDDLGPEMCLVTGNDAATLFRGWGAMLGELTGTGTSESSDEVRAVQGDDRR